MALVNVVGQVNRACSLHYFGALPDLGTAQQLAVAHRAIIGNPANFSSFPDDMFIASPLCALGIYSKAASNTLGATYFPNNFYTHDASGAKIAIFNQAFQLMQADHAAIPPFSDPRGFTATTWKDWRAKDCWKNMDLENNKYANDPFTLGYLDSASADTGIGGAKPVSWQDGHQYTAVEFHDITYTVGDSTIANKVLSGRLVFMNGLRGGVSYYGATATNHLPPHCDGGLAENWQRGNADPATAFHIETDWRKEIDMINDIKNNNGGGACWCIVNINNATAGGSGFVPAPFTAAQVQQWRRYSVASYLLANNGNAFFEFVESTSIKPWQPAADDPYYHVDLGAPLDTFATAISYLNGTTGVYTRRFTNGCVYVNPTLSTKTITTPDRSYKQIDGTTIPGSIVMAPNTGLVVLTLTTTNPPDTGLSQFMKDTFNRTVAAGDVGTADTGQTYTLQGTLTNYSADGTRAIIAATLAGGRRLMVNGISKLDTDWIAQIGINELAVGGNEAIYQWSRVNPAADTAYRLRLFYAPGGVVQYLVQKLVANVATTIGVVQTAPWTQNAGDIIAMELRVEGTNPTTVQGRIWREGVDPIPVTWPASGTDSDVSLQVAGAIGMSMFVETGNTNAPMNYYIYDIDASEIVAAPTANENPTCVILSPNDGDSLQIADGQTTTTFNVVAQSLDTDGSVTGTTLSVNSGTDQVMAFDGINFAKTVILGAGVYTLSCIATDDALGTGSDTITITVLAAVNAGGGGGGGVTPPSTTLTWSVKHLDHNGNAIGEALGQDFRFGKYLGNPGFVSYDLTRDHPLITPDLEPNAVDWGVFLSGDLILAGEITDVERDTDATVVSIAGEDWQGYIEHLLLPYNPANPVNYTRRDTDLKDIVEGLVDHVLSQYPHSIDVIMNNDPMGQVQTWHFSASDLTFLGDMIDSMATQTEGFDWEISPDKELLLYAPKKTGVSDYVLDESNIKQIHFGEQGIRATTLYGRGSGSSNTQIVKSATSTAAAARYRDRVAVLDYTVNGQAAVQSLTNRDIVFQSQQLLQFFVTIFPRVDENVWARIQPGWNVYVNFDDGNIKLNGYYRCVGLETFITQQGDAEVTFNFNTDSTVA